MNNNIYTQVFKAFNNQQKQQPVTNTYYNAVPGPEYYGGYNNDPSYQNPQQPQPQVPNYYAPPVYNNAYQAQQPVYDYGYQDNFGGYSAEDIALQKKQQEMENMMNRNNNAIGTIISDLDSIKGDLLNGYNDILTRINEAGQGVYQNNSDIRNLIDSS